MMLPFFNHSLAHKPHTEVMHMHRYLEEPAILCVIGLKGTFQVLGLDYFDYTKQWRLEAPVCSSSIFASMILRCSREDGEVPENCEFDFSNAIEKPYMWKYGKVFELIRVSLRPGTLRDAAGLYSRAYEYVSNYFWRF